jgi:hypothetical protein
MCAKSVAAKPVAATTTPAAKEGVTPAIAPTTPAIPTTAALTVLIPVEPVATIKADTNVAEDKAEGKAEDKAEGKAERYVSAAADDLPVPDETEQETTATPTVPSPLATRLSVGASTSPVPSTIEQAKSGDTTALLSTIETANKGKASKRGASKHTTNEGASKNTSGHAAQLCPATAGENPTNPANLQPY